MKIGTNVGLGPGHIVLDGDPAPPTERGTAALPHFRPMSIVAKRSPISATAEFLLLKEVQTEFAEVLSLRTVDLSMLAYDEPLCSSLLGYSFGRM